MDINGLSSLLDKLIEYFAVVLSLLCVALSTRESIWTWPTGFIACGIYAFIFFNSGLYGDAGLQLFFMVMQIHGWWSWHRPQGQKGARPVTRLSISYLLIYSFGILAGGALLGFYLDGQTDSDVPYWDSYTTAVSVAGQFLLNRKKIESWIVWIGVDAVYVYVYIYKGLYPTALLYFLYLFLAGYGLWQWRQSEIRSQKSINGQ